MATVTNSIGTASRDYSTIALWEAALPASAVTAGNSYVGQCYNDSEFNLGTTQLVFAGTTTDVTHTITLTTGPGQSFRDDAGAATNPLRYDQSKGVGVTGNIAYGFTLLVNDAFVTIQNLQIKNTNGNALGSIKTDFSTGPDFEIDNCILQSTHGGSSSAVANLFGLRQTVKNSLVISDAADNSEGLHIDQSGSAINCTVVRPTNRSASTSRGIVINYNAVTIQNCAVAGFATATVKNGSANPTGSGNAIDGATYAGTLTGQTSLTIATEFVQPSNASSVMDWRLNSTSVKCRDNGTNSGAPTTDIVGQAIKNTTRDVGAWELQPVTVTNSIGTASRDYSTIALWEAALPASAVTANNKYIGQCYNDTEFNLSTTQTVIGGTTTGVDHNITLTTGPGQSFRDNAGVATNALRYNVSNGVGITAAIAYVDAIRIDEANVTLSNLQIKNTATNGGSFALQSTFSNGSNFVLDSCILECSAGTATTSSVIIFGGTNQKATNCLFVLKSSGTSGGVIFTQDGSLINCDIVRPTNFTAGGAAAKTGYNGITIQNCAIVGFTTIVNNPGSRTLTGSGNATDQASFPTGLSGQTSLTPATEFVQPDNSGSAMDWRLNTTSVACKDNGTNSGAPTTDIIGQAISNTTRDVGAWELQQGGGASGPVGSLYMARQSIQRASYW